jgi:hydrogenase expression/formation protein HypD
VKFLNDYSDASLCKKLARDIKRLAEDLGRPLSFMEVCGTHTMAIFRYGLRQMLPPQVRLISGPGCPVCITPPSYIDLAITISRMAGVTVVTFGDMVRVPGTSSSLEKEKAQGADVRVVYSALGALEIARKNPGKRIVFLAVGFETTSPTVAAGILKARQEGLKNFCILSAHRLIPPAIRALLTAGAKIDGFILPGHVSVIIGSVPYKFISEEFGLPAVITGFEPVDILLALRMLLSQISEKRQEVEIEYSRAVKPEGNERATLTLNQVFEAGEGEWRGLGRIAESALLLKPQFEDFAAEGIFHISPGASQEPSGCRCGEVLCGMLEPEGCGLFGTDCTPQHPIGPCMVSSEGTCAAHYKYARPSDAEHPQDAKRSAAAVKSN